MCYGCRKGSREEPLKGQVEKTPELLLCLILNIAREKPSRCIHCYAEVDRVACVVSKAYEAWSTPAGHRGRTSASSPEANMTSLETFKAEPDTEKW